jgi:hypothetical protein
MATPNSQSVFNFNRTAKRRYIRTIMVCLAALLIMALPVIPRMITVQGQEGGRIEIEGTLVSVSPTEWNIGGVPFEVNSATAIAGNPAIGTIVRVIAFREDDDTFIAISIAVVDSSAASATPSTPTFTPTITSTFTPTFTPTGTLGTPTVTPTAGTVTPTLGTPTPITSTPNGVTYVKIIIEGPVQEIYTDINVVVIYGLRVRLLDNDPAKTQIKVGDWISVGGNLDSDGDQIIIIATVVIVIIDAPVIVIAPGGGGGNSGGGGSGGGGGDDDDDD